MLYAPPEFLLHSCGGGRERAGGLGEHVPVERSPVPLLLEEPQRGQDDELLPSRAAGRTA